MHPDHNRLRVEKGTGEVWIDGHKTKIESGFAIVVPAGARHNVKNTVDKPLRLYTLLRTARTSGWHGARHEG